MMGGACTGVEPAALSASASVAESGVTFLGRGKAQTFQMASLAGAADAVRLAATDMRLTTTRDRHDDNGRVYLSFKDERDASVSIMVKRRTETVTQLKTDVGFFGNGDLAALLLLRTIEHLREAGSAAREEADGPEGPGREAPE